MINNSRSMNEELRRGATDGMYRNARPDSAGAEYEAAVRRSRMLHPSHYGTFGTESDTVPLEAAFDYEVRNVRR